MRAIFRGKTTAYIRAMTKRTRPKKVLICGIYFFSLEGSSWADAILDLAGYHPGGTPEKLKRAIRMVYEYAIKEIKIGNTVARISKKKLQ